MTSRPLSEEEALQIIHLQLMHVKTSKERTLKRVDLDMRAWLMDRSDAQKLKVATVRAIGRQAMALAARAINERLEEMKEDNYDR